MSTELVTARQRRAAQALIALSERTGKKPEQSVYDIAGAEPATQADIEAAEEAEAVNGLVLHEYKRRHAEDVKEGLVTEVHVGSGVEHDVSELLGHGVIVGKDPYQLVVGGDIVSTKLVRARSGRGWYVVKHEETQSADGS